VNAIGTFQIEVTIHGEKYVTQVYVVPDSAMSHAMLLGKELMRKMDINIQNGRVTIRKLAVDNKREKDVVQGRDSRGEESNSDTLSELLFVNYVETSSVDVIGRYRDEIETLIKEHKPRKEVQTNVEIKIVLRDEMPICLRPRRLAVKEKAILNAQIDEWLRDDIIQPSKTRYSNPVVIVSKKNDEHRVCIDSATEQEDNSGSIPECH